MKRLPQRKMEKDDRAQIMGIPLYILIIVIIAAVSLAAILGFMVTTSATPDSIKIQDVMIDGKNETEVICDDIRDDGTAYYKGSERPDSNGSGDLAPEKDYDQYLIITVYDEDGNAMQDVDVEAVGAGVNDVGTTNASGMIKLSLDGCKLQSNVQHSKIKITASHQGLIGESSLDDSIWVKRAT